MLAYRVREYNKKTPPEKQELRKNTKRIKNKRIPRWGRVQMTRAERTRTIKYVLAESSRWLPHRRRVTKKIKHTVMQGKKVRKEKRKTKSRKQGTKTCKQENRTQGVSIATNLPVSCYKAETGTSRRRNMWCAVRSSAKCSLPRVHVTHPYSRVCITSAFSMRNFRASGAASMSYISRLNRL